MMSIILTITSLNDDAKNINYKLRSLYKTTFFKIQQEVLSS